MCETWELELISLPSPPPCHSFSAMSCRIPRASGTIVLLEKKRHWTLSLFQQKLIEESEKQDASGFTLSDEGDIPLVDFSKYETRRFHDSQGREIAVFDGLVDKSYLDALRLFLLHYNSAFAYQPFDGRDEEHDNVSWIAMLKVNTYG